MADAITLRAMTPDDYPQVCALWQRCEGLGEVESEQQFRDFLQRNPQDSPVACRGGALVGAVLCGWDGRRGYLSHLAVDPGARRQQVGRLLVEWCVARLHARGATRCSVHVYLHNPAAEAFWLALGWRRRSDLQVLAIDLPQTIR